jgi:DNA-binding IclR family transcriptional regulator
MYRYIALLRETGLLIGDDHGCYQLSARLISLARAAEAAESIIEIGQVRAAAARLSGLITDAHR